MLRAGTITPEMHDAAKDFEAAFIVANLDPLRALPILRVPGTGPEQDLNERQLRGRRRVQTALQALGGISSPAGVMCVARCWPAAKSTRVGNAPRLGRATGAPGAGAGDSSGSARDAGGARRGWRGQAGLLKQAQQVPIIPVGARSSRGWRIQSDAHAFDLLDG